MCILCVTVLSAFGCAPPIVTPVQIGTSNLAVQNQILHLNKIAEMRVRGDFRNLAVYLEKSLKKYSNDNFATRRLLNELASIYSYNIFDLEQAVRVDEQLSALKQEDARSIYYPKSTAANETLLADRDYINNFIDIDASQINRSSKSRSKRNNALLNSVNFTVKDPYSNSLLNDNFKKVSAELGRVGEEGQLKNMLASRALKIEFELMRNGRNFQPLGCHWIEDRELTIEQVDLNEIDFLELADYLIVCFEKTNQVDFAELALQVLYKPYSYIESKKSRLKYNSRINEYIDILINAYFRESKFDEMLYFISLNKSRVLLENIQSNTSLNQDERYIRSADGVLPDRDSFFLKLERTNSFYDYYVLNSSPYIGLESQTIDLDNMLASRGFVRAIKVRKKVLPKTPDSPQASGEAQLIVSFVNNGLVKSRILSIDETQSIRATMDQAYKIVLSRNQLGSEYTRQITTTLIPSAVDSSIHVSVDNFLAKHPLSLYLNKSIVRVLNLFTFEDQQVSQELAIAGFFNPTGDLSNAAKEAELIQSYFPSSSQVLVGEKASLKNFKSTVGANVIHMSTHAVFTPEEPLDSALVFSEFKYSEGRDEQLIEVLLENFDFGDPGTLTAREMENISTLKNNHLVFAAACQTGVIGESKENRKEIEGILRPLLLNDNRFLLLSLWDIADASAKDFVDSFYRNLKKTNDVKMSFFSAQEYVKEIYEHPWHWSAYYLVQN